MPDSKTTNRAGIKTGSHLHETSGGKWIAIAALNLFIAVAAGAFGAHGLKKIITPDMLAIWQTGVHYQMIHALGLLAIGLCQPRFPSKKLTLAGIFMSTGILLFSGSLYALALSRLHGIGVITPIGGVAFLTSWLLLAWAAWPVSSQTKP